MDKIKNPPPRIKIPFYGNFLMKHNVDKTHNEIWFLIFITIIATLSLFFIHNMLPLFYWVSVSILLISVPMIIVSIVIFYILKPVPKKTLTQYKTYLLIALFIPLSTQILAQVVPYVRSGDTPPQLVWTYHEGDFGINDMAVIWWTSVPTKNSFQWGNDSDSWTISEDTKSNIHAFVMHNLILNTCYWYRVNNGNKTYFKTPDPTNMNISFISDVHYGSSARNSEEFKNVMEHLKTDMFFSIGDLVDVGAYDKLWKGIFKEINVITASTPTGYILGNHDGLFNGYRLYHDFCYPKGLPTDSNSPYYGLISIGNIHIFMLHLEWDSYDYTQQQREWFESKLKTLNPDDLIIVLSHAPYLSSTYNVGGKSYFNITDLGTYFPKLFEKYGVDVTFSGHQHQCEHLRKGDVDYNVIGVGGGIIRNYPSNIAPESIFLKNATHVGFATLHIRSSNASVSYINSTMDTFYSYPIGIVNSTYP